MRWASLREYSSWMSTCVASALNSAADSRSMASGSSVCASANFAILPRNSVMMRSAVFLPTYGKPSRNAASPRSMASAISFSGRTRHFSAFMKPTPGTVVNTSKNSRSSGSRKPTSLGVRWPPPTAPSM